VDLNGSLTSLCTTCIKEFMRFFRCLFFVALLAGPRCVRADYIAVVDPHSIIVTNFEGWGTSLCWWANVIGAYSNRNDFVDLAFSKLKLNIVRYNIGGGENPAATNTITHYRAAMQGFEPTNGVWDWNAAERHPADMRSSIIARPLLRRIRPERSTGACAG